MAFTEIPILDLAKAKSPETKPKFLHDLRDALLNVGFLYIKNTGIKQELFDRVCEEGIQFFDLPEDEKLRIEMKNEKSFLGYSRVCPNLHVVHDSTTNVLPVGQRNHRSKGRLARAA